MSTVKIAENITQVTNGTQVPVLQFVRQNRALASELSKATPGQERATRDSIGNRKLNTPDVASLISVHRSISRRNKDAKLTFQMLPDLKLALEMVVSLIMSPKDAFSDEILIRSDSLNLLPASVMQSMLQVVTDYYDKNYDLSEFTQRMLEETLGYQGGLPVVVIPENALDDLINNYNGEVSVESFKKEFDLERNIPHPLQLLGVPDYLLGTTNKNTAQSNRLNTGRAVRFDLESYSSKGTAMGRPMASSANAYMHLSKLMPHKDAKDGEHMPWTFEIKNASNESITVNADELIYVTDNMSSLKLADMRDRALSMRSNEALNKRGYNKLQASLESVQETFKKKMAAKVTGEGINGRVPTDAEVESLIYKNRRFAYTPIASIRTSAQLKRNSIGESLIKILDSACFIPVGVQGDPTRKLGGYIMLDEDGVPLSTYDFTGDQLLDLSSYANGAGNFVSSMNDRSNTVMNGKQTGKDDVPTQLLQKFFTRATAEMVDKDLIERVKTGQYPNGVELATTEDTAWLFLTRCLKGQRTQMLWVPAEHLVYFAMDYDELGFGKSLLDDIRNLSSMRIMLMVAGIAASLRNSIGRTKVSIKMDEEDDDAGKTLEDIQDEILKSRMNPIPFGVNNVADISKYLQRSCYEFEVTGNSALPDMQINFEQFNSNYPKPDEELQNQLKDLTIQHFGLTRDMIDAASGMDFAIQAATNNLLTMKRVLRWQRKVTPQVTELVRMISRNSESQITELREILKNNFDSLQINKIKSYFNIDDVNMMKDESFRKLVVEQCLNEFINHLYVELPSPAATTLEAQKQMFEDAAEFYKSALEYIINESFFDTSVQGEGLSDHVDMIKNIMLSHYMRDFMAKNAILPELAELTTLDEDGKVGMNVMDSLEKHIKALGMSTGNFFSRFKEFSIKQTALFQDVPDSSTTGETETGGGSGGSDSGSDGGGGDDLDFGFDDPDADPNANPDEDPDADPEGEGSDSAPKVEDEAEPET